MAFTIGRYGFSALRPLAASDGQLLSDVPVVHPGRAGNASPRLPVSTFFAFSRTSKDELLTVLGTSSSETALVPLMHKLERLGCSKSVVGLVVPSGYPSISMARTSTSRWRRYSWLRL